MRKIFIFLYYSGVLLSQDTMIYKSSVAGSSLKVPNCKIWEVESVFITANDGYNIKVSNNFFKKVYKSNDTIISPFYIAEMELLSNKTFVNYLFRIKQRNE